MLAIFLSLGSEFRHQLSVQGSARIGLIFQQKIGGDTAGLADTNLPKKIGCLIRCVILGSRWGSWAGGK